MGTRKTDWACLPWGGIGGGPRIPMYRSERFGVYE